jgi:hypothetical protein
MTPGAVLSGVCCLPRPSGAGWLIFLLPRLTLSMSRCIEGVGILAEGLLMLWLLVRGVKRPAFLVVCWWISVVDQDDFDAGLGGLEA